MASGSIIIDLLLKTGAFETDTKRAEKRWQNFSSEIKGGAATIAAALAGAFAVGKAIPLMDEYSQMAARVRNATDSVREYNAVQTRLQQSANITYRKVSEAGEGFLAFATPMKALGRSTEEVLDLTDSLSFSFTANAARADQAQSAQDALAKSMAKGKVDADNWMSILMAADNVAGQIAKTMGITEAEVRQLGASGKLGLNDLINGLIAAKDENQALAESMSASWQDGITKLTNDITVFLGKFNEAWGVTAKGAAVLSTVGDHFDKVAMAATALAAVYAGRVLGAQYAVISAKIKDIAASIVLARANQAVASAAGTAAVAQSRALIAGRALLGVFGGPVGLAVTVAATAAGYLLLQGAADATTDALDGQQQSIADLAAEYQKLNDAQRFIRLDAVRKNLAELRDDFERTKKFLHGNNQDGSLEIFERFKTGVIDSKQLLAELHAQEIFPPERLKQIEQAAQKFDAAKDAVKRTEQEERLLVDTTYRLGEAAKAGKSGADKMAGSLQSVSTAAKEAAEAIGKLNNSMFDDIATSAVKLEMLKRGYSENIAGKVAEFTVKTGSFIDGDATKSYLQGQIALENLTGKVDKHTEALKKQAEQAKKNASAFTVNNKVLAQAAKYDYAGIEQRRGLPKGVLSALSMQESRGNPGAVSPVGARGLFQFMPDTAKRFGVNVNDARSSAEGAAKYLQILLKRYSGDLNKALTAYHSGEGNVDKGKIGPVGRRYAPEVMARMNWAGGGSGEIDNDPRRRFVDIAGMTNQADEYIARLKEQQALVGKNTELEKALTLIQLGKYGEVTPKQQAEIEGLLKSIEAQQKATEEAQKYQDLIKEITAPVGIVKFAADLELANKELEDGVITLEQYDRWLKRLQEENPVPDIPDPKNTAVGDWIENAMNVTAQVDGAWANMLGSMTDGLTDFVTGSRVSLRSFVADVIKMFLKIAIARQIAGFAASAFGGGSAAVGGGGQFDALFADGGYTGSGAKYEPAGIVHKGEVVFSQRDVLNHGGVAAVERLRLRGYSGGGVVGGLPAAVGGMAGGGNTTINVTINRDGGSEAESQADSDMGKALAQALPQMIEQWYIKNVARPGAVYNKG